MSLTTDVSTIVNAAIHYAHPAAVCRRSLVFNRGVLTVTDQAGSRFFYDLTPFTGIVIAGAGKAAAGMGLAVSALFSGQRSCRGAVIAPAGSAAEMPDDITVYTGAHPFPDESSLKGGRALLNLAATAHAGDFFMFLISGGASSLFTALTPGISLSRYNTMVHALFDQGASIQEINTVRTAFSRVKGGRFAALLEHIPLLTLALSDVPGDDPAVIGSGPTVHTRPRVSARYILRKYNLINILSPEMQYRAGLHIKAAGDRPGKAAQNRFYHIIGGNHTALEGARKAAEDLGYTVLVNYTPLNCPVEKAARHFMQKITAFQTSSKHRFCYIRGGETTLTVTGTGMGGRNQELALRILKDAPSLKRIAFLTAGTDGIDGNSSAAGAIIDQTVKQRAAELELDPAGYLADNNSHAFFSKAGGLVQTGPTGTNVMDIQILLVSD